MPETAAIGLSESDTQKLGAPFPLNKLGVKVQSLNRDRTRAMLVLYLQHIEVQQRLQEVDPSWSCIAVSETRTGDTVYVRKRMTVKGVTREEVGEGSDLKSAFSDAMKRCALRFAVGAYLYDVPAVWVEYNEARDKYRDWTIDDYRRALTPDQRQQFDNVASTPKTTASQPNPTREVLNGKLMALYRPYLSAFPETKFPELLMERYAQGESKFLSLEQLEDLVKFLEVRLSPASQPQEPKGPSTAQISRLFAIAGEHGWHEDQLRVYIAEAFRLDSIKKLAPKQYEQLVSVVRAASPETAMQELEQTRRGK